VNWKQVIIVCKWNRISQCKP